ncbi:MAG: UDP-N-acetylmuramoylalanyl-D-glutamyl-2,6-diaminopimelate/D-alanyl-D-alanyl ligase [Chthoniobacter sp.]|nr:UDP-N-acetylmuramoylalanyl-D-glutamyl-2,6-diaminopimelate/D-alanyl-D-alanyl ligase [Chthoniobacter sp.]
MLGPSTGTVTTVCTDSRALKAGDLFVALRGDNFDGHSFVAEAARRGAAAAIVEEVPPELVTGFGVIQVANTLRALQNLASEYRRSLPMQVVGITGSNGKTSTKDAAACVLGEHFQVTKTEGNFNNHIGLPLTILRARTGDQVGVFEMGMNHPGEIAPLAAMAAPDVAIITGIGVAHIEFMGTREAIALEKGMLAEALPPSGTLILSAHDDFSQALAKRTKADAVFAGIDAGDVRASDLRPHFTGTRFKLSADGHSVDAEIPVPGEHMVRNALLAVAAGRVFGLSLEECAAGLQKLRVTKGRLEHKTVRGIQILDDTYNANPDSMTAALRTLASLPAAGRRIAVLGRMGELGVEAQRGHQQVGEAAAREHIDCVVGVGEEAEWIADSAWRGGVEKVVKVPDTDEATKLLRLYARPGDVLLIKGSRSAKMERIVEGLQTP